MADSVRNPLIEVADTVKNLLGSSDYSDLTITCGESSYKVHKAIVCSRSDFFRRAQRFPTGMGQNQHTINLPEDEDHVIKQLIQYLYEGEYEPKIPRDEAGQISSAIPVLKIIKDARYHYIFPHTCSRECPSPQHMVFPHHRCGRDTCNDACRNFVCSQCCKLVPGMADEPEQMLFHAKLYEIGERYVVDGLKELAQEKFDSSCNSHWDTSQFAAAVQYVFSSTAEDDTGLRDIAIQTISDHIDVLNKPEVEALLYEFNNLAVGLLRNNAALLRWNRASARKDTGHL